MPASPQTGGRTAEEGKIILSSAVIFMPGRKEEPENAQAFWKLRSAESRRMSRVEYWEKTKGGMAAGALGPSRKGSPCRRPR